MAQLQGYLEQCSAIARGHGVKLTAGELQWMLHAGKSVLCWDDVGRVLGFVVVEPECDVARLREFFVCPLNPDPAAVALHLLDEVERNCVEPIHVAECPGDVPEAQRAIFHAAGFSEQRVKRVRYLAGTWNTSEVFVFQRGVRL